MKAAFFDIDGTLWDGQIGISDSTKTAIRELKKNGVFVILCSGRALAAIKNPELLALKADGIIAGCGTYVEFQGKELLHKALPQQYIERTYMIMKQHAFPMVLEGKNYYYIDAADLESTPFFRPLAIEAGEHLRGIENEFMRWEASKFVAFVKGRQYQTAVEQLSDLFNITVHEEIMMEGVPKDYSKVSGIKLLCDTAGVAKENIYAFGDSINDIEMLQYAACGIAMGNGSQEAKNAADFVTKSIREDGIYYACKHFSLI